MAGITRKKRVPKLKFTDTRNIGWHVSYRDPKTGTPCKHPFNADTKGEAEKLYHEWVAAFLQGSLPSKSKRQKPTATNPKLAPGTAKAQVVTGSLLHVASSLLKYEQSRIRQEGEQRRQGTISEELYNCRKNYAKEILSYFDSIYGEGSVGKMKLADITMNDVEKFNKLLVGSGCSQSSVSKQIQFLKTLIDRAGRPEHGSQILSWNWNARDKHHGKPTVKRKLPTLNQLKLILNDCGVRETTMVWLAIGCGFGQKDLAAIRVGQIDRKGYDLRRGKTGIERYGDTPLMVWKSISTYLKTVERKTGELMFITRRSTPLVSSTTDTVANWWSKLRKKLDEDGRSLGGFYTLRHLGATEYGCRPSCSIGDMKRWLGHSASSQVADVYMKPVSPEDRAVVEWVRKSLKTGKADMKVSR